MKRNTTVAIVFALILIADLIAAKQTVRMQDALGPVAAALFAVEAIAASFTALLALAVMRKSFRRQKRPLSRKWRFEIVRPLRRLFVSVSS